MEAIPRQRGENVQVRADAREPLERPVHLGEEGQGGEGSGPSELGAGKQGRTSASPSVQEQGPEAPPLRDPVKLLQGPMSAHYVSDR